MNRLRYNSLSTDYQSSKATSRRHDKANGMSTLVHGTTESIKNTNDNNDWTTDFQWSKATLQHHNLEQTKSTIDSQPCIGYFNFNYYVVAIVLGYVLFVSFIFGMILWKCYPPDHYFS
ncbi:hypothetical protein MN116_000272 [Schistosoma mekongi]|uniref:Uncharacterized protein n=1 Tax=Schistosoma mekongi TaxID=38744 RepID=A0AAE2D1E1_SCHME|nr:hypothetical protein MN116_000272 [Schistosoma mekongi]